MKNYLYRSKVLDGFQVCIYALLLLALSMSGGVYAQYEPTLSNGNKGFVNGNDTNGDDAFNFGEVVIGEYKDIIFIFENIAGNPVEITGITVSGNDFTLWSAGTCSVGTKVNVNESCTFTDRFEPSAPPGSKIGTGTVLYKTAGCTSGCTIRSIEYTLQGTGIVSPAAPSITITTPLRPQQIFIGDSISFASNATSANTLFNPTYSWSFPGGAPSSSTLEDPGNVQFNSFGTHTVTVTVTDQSNGKIASDSVSVQVIDPVPSITINAPNPLTIKAGNSVNFASTASSANPNFNPSYSWSFPEGLPSSSNEQNPAGVQFNTVGSHTVTATVTDQDNGKTASASTTIVVEVNEAIPQIIISSPALSPLQVKAGDSIYFASETSSDNPNFDPSYSWSFPGGKPSSDSQEDPGNVQFTVGSHRVRVTVTDQSNGTTASDTTIVQVTEAEDPEAEDTEVTLIPETNDGVGRAGLNLGAVSQNAAPVMKTLAIKNGSTDELTIETLEVVGRGFSFGPADNVCGGPKSAGITRADVEIILEPEEACNVGIGFDPNPDVGVPLPAGLHAGLLKIDTIVGQRIIELIVKVEGPQTSFVGGRLLNLSTNSFVDSDGMVAGFIVTGTETRRFVILGENMQDLTDPELMLTDHTGEVLYASNDNWQDHPSAADIETELPVPGTAQDAAFAITLEPGIYLAWLSDRTGQTGTGLLSITDISAPPSGDATRLLNISTSSEVGRAVTIAGFIVSGLDSADFVIMGERMNGSALNPRLRLTDIEGEIEYASNNDWQTHPTASEVELLDRAPGSLTDAAFAITLEPGIYLAWLESETGELGQGLISITEVLGLESK
ncbi:MAG: PKD domain-containing protein [Gammaproteobacteria bacterium]